MMRRKSTCQPAADGSDKRPPTGSPVRAGHRAQAGNWEARLGVGSARNQLSVRAPYTIGGREHADRRSFLWGFLRCKKLPFCAKICHFFRISSGFGPAYRCNCYPKKRTISLSKLAGAIASGYRPIEPAISSAFKPGKKIVVPICANLCHFANPQPSGC